MGIVEKLEQYISNFEPTEGKSVITLATIMCILTVYCVRAVYITSIEEIFMNTDKKVKNDILKLFSILVVFIPTNFLLATDVSFILIEITFCFSLLIALILYKIKEVKIAKNSNYLHKLQSYYKNKQVDIVLGIIICIMPAIIIIWRTINNTIPIFSCVVIVSVIEVAIIGISIPEMLVKRAMNYIIREDEKIFIYRRMEDDTIICGDNESISQASKYIVISLDELKTEIIHHQKNIYITRQEIKELCKEIKTNKGKNKAKKKK